MTIKLKVSSEEIDVDIEQSTEKTYFTSSEMLSLIKETCNVVAEKSLLIINNKNQQK